MFYVLVVVYYIAISSNVGVGIGTTSQQIGPFSTEAACKAAGTKNVQEYEKSSVTGGTFNPSIRGGATFSCMQIDEMGNKK